MITLGNGTTITYVSSGLFQSDGIWIHPERIIDTKEIIFVSQGPVYICEEDEYYELGKNDFLILEPGKKHFGYKSTETPVSFYWVHYNTNMNKIIPSQKSGTLNHPHLLKTLFSQILHITNTPDYDENCSDIYIAAIIEELKFQIKTQSCDTGVLASRIKEHIRININEPITVKSIAKHFGYHENYITKVFKTSYGIGIKKYIDDLKLNNAKTLLSTTLYSIKEIAFMTGFSSENLFVKFFKYHVSMTPSEYRKIYVNIHYNKK